MHRGSLRRAGMAAAVAVALSACGGSASEPQGAATSAPSSTGTTRSPDDGGAEVTEPVGTVEGADNAAALTFTGVDLDGTRVSGETFAGGDVVLWMWAPW